MQLAAFAMDLKKIDNFAPKKNIAISTYIGSNIIDTFMRFPTFSMFLFDGCMLFFCDQAVILLYMHIIVLNR